MRKQVLFVAFVYLGIVSLFAAKLHAFEFGIWKSGMSMREVKKIARERGILLNKSNGKIGRILGLSYLSKVLGEQAQITLAFTPQKRLHMVIVTWDNNYTPTKAKKNLCRKYGTPTCEETKKLFLKKCMWWPDPYTKILLEKKEDKISLIYWDWSLIRIVASKSPQK